MPSIEAAVISASVTIPQGAPVKTTGEAVAELEAGAAPPAAARGDRRRRLLARAGGRRRPADSVAAVGRTDRRSVRRPLSNVGEVAIELLPTEQRIYGSE